MSSSLTGQFPFYRPRRLRRSPALRRLVAETRLSVEQLVLPMFVRAGRKVRRAVEAMPGVFQLSPDELTREASQAWALGLPAVLLFGIPDRKDPKGSGAYNRNGIVQQAVRLLKKEVAFCDACAERQLVYVAFFARLLPMISFGLVSYGAGLTRIPTRAFALSTLLGMIPLTLIVTYLGGNIVSFNGTSLVFGAILVASFFLVPIWIKRKNPWGLYERLEGTPRDQKKPEPACQ